MLHKVVLAGKTNLHVSFWHHEVTGTHPLLLLHGHGGDHRGLIKLAKHIPVTTFVLDLPGFGDSEELSAHTIKEYTAVIEEFVTENNISEYDVFGHSLGSAFALAVAASDTRVKRLIMVNPIPEFSTFIRKLLRVVSVTATALPPNIGEALVHTRLYNIVTFLLHSRKKLNPEHAGDYLRTQNTSRYSLKAWQESGTAIYDMDQQSYAKRITIPTMIIHGDKDKMTSVKAVAQFVDLFSSGQLVRLPKAGHFAPLEDIAEIAEHINTFLV